jgi:two-component system copper resistance phosphate regulon response regulator CusR
MKILLVEDEHKIANSIKQGLTQENFLVDLAYDGLSGFDLASTENFDLIILDRLLPGMDGLTICVKLRKLGNHTPILMLTAKSQTEDKVEGLNSGADDYLAKPFAFEELLARIKALSRRPDVTLGEEITVKNLSLNSTTFEVKRMDKNINLSSKEFLILEYLMKHKGKILTKDQIISHVWNYDADVLPNTVEVFIGYIRNKIDKPFKNAKPLIHTVRGFGYRLE